MSTPPLSAASRSTARAAVLAIASIGLAGAVQAQGHHSRGGGVYVQGGYGHGGYGHGGYGRGGYYRGGYGGGGWPAWGAVGLGLGLGIGLGSYYAYGAPAYVVAPTYTVVESPPTVVYETPRPVPRYAAPLQPVIYPRNGQSAAQIDADSNACSEWAGGQPNAQADGSVFHRGIAACMDARGYTLR